MRFLPQQFPASSIKNLFHNCFFVKQSSSNQFPRWRHGSLCSLFSLCMYFHGFFPPIVQCPFSMSSPSIFRPINTSYTFPRWHHHSVYSLFSYRTHLCAFFPRKFCAKILHLNTSHPFARWRHHYIWCLYSFLDEFLCVTLRY